MTQNGKIRHTEVSKTNTFIDSKSVHVQGHLNYSLGQKIQNKDAFLNM